MPDANEKATLIDPRDVIGCACPRTDGRDCIRARHARVKFTPLSGDPPIEDNDDEECQCSCHDYCDCCQSCHADCICEGGPY